jgi:hypothetical protein
MAPKIAPASTPRDSEHQTALSLDQVDEVHRIQRRIQLRTGLIHYLLEKDQHANTKEPFVGEITVLDAVQELLEDINDAAERIAKIMIAAQKASVVGKASRPGKIGSKPEPISGPPTREEAGIDKKLSSQSQKLAAVPVKADTVTKGGAS